MPGSQDEGGGAGSQDEVLEVTNVRVYTQDTEPTLEENDSIAIWVNPSAANQTMLIFRRAPGAQTSVELS